VKGIYLAQTFDKKSEANEWGEAQKVRARAIARDGVAPPPKGSTLAELVDKYLELAPKDAFGASKRRQLGLIRRMLGKIKLADLNAAHLDRFIDVRLKEVAGSTVAGDLAYLSSLLKWGKYARRHDVRPEIAIAARASLSYRPGVSTTTNEREREPTAGELKTLFAHWKIKPPKSGIDMETIVKFALASAMRQSEICSLQINDIDRVEKTVVVRDRKHPKKKIGNNMTVPLLKDAWAIVQPLIKGKTEGALFPYVANTVSVEFALACKLLEIDDLRFHDLRHAAAAEFFRRGLSIQEVALLTGHRDWSQLKRYADIKAADVHAKEKRVGGKP
jgi:integrase